MLKPNPTTTNYIFIIVGSGFSSSRGSLWRELGGMVNYIQLTIIQCCSNFCCIVTLLLHMNCWLILLSCCKTRQKMLVFDRPSIFPLILVFLPCSPLYSLPFPFDTIAYCLVAGRKTRGYTRYSPALFSFIVLPDRPL